MLENAVELKVLRSSATQQPDTQSPYRETFGEAPVIYGLAADLAL